jgi:hypothetical protein
MGATHCDIHGIATIGMACNHIVDNIRTGKNAKCFDIKVKALPGNEVAGSKLRMDHS